MAFFTAAGKVAYDAAIIAVKVVPATAPLSGFQRVGVEGGELWRELFV